MAKKQDNEVNALSHSVFRRMVKGARMSLNGIRAEIDEIPGEHPQAAARFAALREAAKEEHAAFMQRADAYMEAEHLPEGLSEEELLEGIQQVKTLHQQIRCLLAVTCPIAPTHPATHSLAARLPQIPLPHFDGDFRRWVAFRDTFTALVVNQPDLTDVERLLYLRDALQGDAIATIQNIPVREGQFQAAWDTLHQAVLPEPGIVINETAQGSSAIEAHEEHPVGHESPSLVREVKRPRSTRVKKPSIKILEAVSADLSEGCTQVKKRMSKISRASPKNSKCVADSEFKSTSSLDLENSAAATSKRTSTRVKKIVVYRDEPLTG
uniref:Uncharacterized protein n=1 Tax=Rhodnius prolixus TaxID=13249 RepID=T1IBX9_RHOPR